MRFFLLFDSTPLVSSIPLKALTSQGKRFDVFCRMCRSCLIFDGKPTRDDVDAWFPAGGNNPSPVKLSINGSLIADEFLLENFHSELVIANLFKNIMKGVLEVPGISVDKLDPAINLPLAFLEMVKQEKEQTTLKIIMMHETGIATLASNGVNAIVPSTLFGEDIIAIIGNHDGFPGIIENELLSSSDHVLCMSSISPLPGSQSISYLGSQVIDMLHYFFSRACYEVIDKKIKRFRQA